MFNQNKANGVFAEAAPNATRYTNAAKVIWEKINKVQQTGSSALSHTMHFNLPSLLPLSLSLALQFPRGITGAKISNTFHLVELNEANSIKSKATERGGDNPVLIRRKPNTVVFFPCYSGNIVTPPGLEYARRRRYLPRAQTELSSAHFGIHYARINFNGCRWSRL